MPSRRDFLTTLAAGLTASALADRWAMAVWVLGAFLLLLHHFGDWIWALARR